MKALIPVMMIISAVFYSCATSTPQQEPEVVPVEQPEPEPEPVPEPEEVPDDDGKFEVTQEVYDKTHDEIDELITKLNEVISKRDFDSWLIYLSNDYINTYTSEETLNEISQYPQLKDNGIVLESLEDYFNWVIVPSRSRAILNEIVFADEKRVIAYSSYSGKRARLYELEKIDGRWLVSEWE